MFGFFNNEKRVEKVELKKRSYEELEKEFAKLGVDINSGQSPNCKTMPEEERLTNLRYSLDALQIEKELDDLAEFIDHMPFFLGRSREESMDLIEVGRNAKSLAEKEKGKAKEKSREKDRKAKYIIVTEDSYEELAEKVNDKMNEGFVCRHGIKTSKNGGYKVYHQQMVRRKY